MSNPARFETLHGKVFDKIQIIKDDHEQDEILFITSDGEIYKLYHEQECCEEVEIKDICGDLEGLIGTPILLAEEVTQESEVDDDEYNYYSSTWTFYKLSTIKGSVTISWLGLSNGYHSESVDFCKVE